METFLRDLRYALRQLRNSPGFTIAALGTMALGVGANTAVFSATYAVLLKALPFRDANRIVSIAETHPQVPGPAQVTYPDYLDWITQQKSFEQLAAYSVLNPATVSLYRDGHSEQLHRVLASGSFFPLLGITPLAGRTLNVQDETPGADHVAVLSETAWQRYFGRDPSAVGGRVELNGSEFTVVGVIPDDSGFPADGEVWLPLSLLDQPTQASRVWHSVDVLGRLRAGVTEAEAAADMRTIAARLANSYPATNRKIGAQVAPLRERLVGSFRTALLFIMGSVFLVLLIACANVANLLLVRASAGRDQIAIRRALGMSTGRLFSQQLALSLIISLLGGAIGIALGWALLPILRFALSHLPGLDASLVQSVKLSLPILTSTLAICLFTAVLFGILPVFGPALNLSEQLRSAGRKATRASGRSRDILLSGEIAVAVVVLFLGLLLSRSFEKLLAVHPGYRTDHLLSFEVTLPGPKFQANAAATDQFFVQLIDRISHAPGVISVGSTNEVPLSPSHSMTRFLIKGAQAVEPGAFPVAQIRTVNPDFFTTMGLRLEEGRIFTKVELSNRSNVFVVNQSFADQYLRGRDPIGAEIIVGVLSSSPVSIPIIGVVSNARDTGIESEAPAEIFAAGYGLHEVILVRSDVDPVSAVSEIRDSVYRIDSKQPVYDIRTAGEIVSESIASQRMTAILLSIFACVALALAGIGVYGVVSYAEALRTQEMGIRMAIGAKRSDIVTLVFRKSAYFGVGGLVAGMVLAFFVSRAVRGLLFDVTTADAVSMAGTMAIVLAMIGLGIAVPAYRASRTNPADALRME
jgi:predicted permease